MPTLFLNFFIQDYLSYHLLILQIWCTDFCFFFIIILASLSKWWLASRNSSLEYPEWTVGHIIIITNKHLLSTYPMAATKCFTGTSSYKDTYSVLYHEFLWESDLGLFPTQEQPHISCFVFYYYETNCPQTTAVFLFFIFSFHDWMHWQVILLLDLVSAGHWSSWKFQNGLTHRADRWCRLLAFGQGFQLSSFWASPHGCLNFQQSGSHQVTSSELY